MERPRRKRNRWDDWDYSAPGYYFITVCTLDRRCLFWASRVGADIIRPEHPSLSRAGVLVEQGILSIPRHYSGISLEKYVIMPNHIHLILRILDTCGRMISAPTQPLPTRKPIPVVIGQMKRSVSKQFGHPIWQKGFYDHVIRNEADYLRIWQYIDQNPAKWREDCYYEEGNL